MQTSPLTLPCSAAQPCPVLSFAQPPAVRWLWITSASMVHRIRWDRGFKNKPGPAINKEKTPVTHPVNYPSSLLEDNIGWEQSKQECSSCCSRGRTPGVAPAWGLSCLRALLPAPGMSLPALLGAAPTSSASALTGQLLPPSPHAQLQTHPSSPSSNPVLTWSWQGPEVCKTRTPQVLG